MPSGTFPWYTQPIQPPVRMVIALHACLHSFHPVIQTWFAEAFPAPTPPQILGWPAIASGKSVLLLAPTGSGKTLAAFLKGIDWLYRAQLESPEQAQSHSGPRVLYVSPLKALNNDIAKNLEAPIQGIRQCAAKLGYPLPTVTTAVRTGDTPSRERQRMVRRPPQILITTPESLFLMLSSKARSILRSVECVIVDEIHTLFPEKRGAHLAASLERLQYQVGARPLQRIGLSATMQPLADIAAFLAGPGRPVEIIDAGQRRAYDLALAMPVADFRRLPEHTVWPSIYRKVWELIQQHTTTLVFVNNRRLAERLTANLNQLAGRDVARTHHGSLAKEARLRSEEQLKAGEIPCIVATSSLELGIDVGHIDLVIQIESPKEVARGMQRVGRAGHVLGLPSRGRLIPKTSMDLVELCAMQHAIKEARVEPRRAPRNCLDILAQQLTAMTTEQDWTPEAMYQVLRASYPFSDLVWEDFTAVLSMLAGLTGTDGAALKPRLHWDRAANVVSADPYGTRLVYSNSGTIPNRGYFGVYLAGSQARLGELDEEFVFERRLGERFVLGTSIWRIEEIRQDRVIVTRSQTPAANVPFWKGEALGRSWHFGRQVGGFLRAAESHLPEEPDSFRRWLEENYLTADAAAALNVQRFLQAQQEAVGHLPTDQHLVIEEFLNEAGQWHVLLHSPYGRRFHLLLGLLVQAQFQQETGVRSEMLPSDNGLLLHAPDWDAPPTINWQTLPIDDLQTQAAQLASETNLFGTAFRHAAQRSLVLSFLSYGRRRTPLWLSRLKAGDLLQMAAQWPGFPLIKEAYREVLEDYFDLEAVETLIRKVQTGSIGVHTVRRQTPSPFAHEHLFGFVGAQMYTNDTPKTQLPPPEKGSAAAGTPQVVFSAAAAQAAAAALRDDDWVLRQPTPQRVLYWLERLGDVAETEVPKALRPVVEALKAEEKVMSLGPSWPSLLTSSVFAETWVCAQQDKSAAAWASVIRAYAAVRPPFDRETLRQRYGIPDELLAQALSSLTDQELLLQGQFVKGASSGQYCTPAMLRRLHQERRREAWHRSAPKDAAEFSTFLAEWHEVTGSASGFETLQDAIDRLGWLWLPLPQWESSLLPARVTDYEAPMLDQLLASGLYQWRARQAGPRILVRFEPTLGESAGVAGWTPNPLSEEHFDSDNLTEPSRRIWEILSSGGALGLLALAKTADLSLSQTWEGLEPLILTGLVSNDSFGPLRLLGGTSSRQRLDPRLLTQPKMLAQMGRFAPLPPSVARTAADQAATLLQRFGVASRDMAQAENLSWASIYPVLDYWETIERVQRGYFVDDLSGIQFGLPKAVRQLSRLREPADSWWVLAEEDPAGFAVRAAGSDSAHMRGYTVFCGGVPLLSARKRHLEFTARQELAPETLHRCLQELLPVLYRLYPDTRITASQYDGRPVVQTPAAAVLMAFGFERADPVLVQWPSQRR